MVNSKDAQNTDSHVEHPLSSKSNSLYYEDMLSRPERATALWRTDFDLVGGAHGSRLEDAEGKGWSLFGLIKTRRRDERLRRWPQVDRGRSADAPNCSALSSSSAHPSLHAKEEQVERGGGGRPPLRSQATFAFICLLVFNSLTWDDGVDSCVCLFSKSGFYSQLYLSDSFKCN